MSAVARHEQPAREALQPAAISHARGVTSVLATQPAMEDDYGLMIKLKSSTQPFLATLALWSGVIGSAWYWTVNAKPQARPLVASVAASSNLPDPYNAEGLARLLGVRPLTAADDGSKRFALLGVIASSSGRGAALISVDGAPARPFAVGTPIEGGLMLQSVGRGEALLAESALAETHLTLVLAAPSEAPASGLPTASTTPVTTPIPQAGAISVIPATPAPGADTSGSSARSASELPAKAGSSARGNFPRQGAASSRGDDH